MTICIWWIGTETTISRPPVRKGLPFFGHLIKDCLERTHTAYDRERAFKAIELALSAQENAEVIKTV